MAKKIGIIIGSTRPGRSADKVLSWFAPQVEKILSGSKEFQAKGITTEVIDLKEWNLPIFDEPGYPSQGKYEHDLTKKWSAKIKEFDGFIILAAEYNHGYTAGLKNAIDYLYVEWNNKPVSFVSYGSAAGGSRAVEQLRQVVVELQMIPLREQVVIGLQDFFKAEKPEDFEKWNVQAEKTIKQIFSRV